jgi:hypothetical protein
MKVINKKKNGFALLVAAVVLALMSPMTVATAEGEGENLSDAAPVYNNTMVEKDDKDRYSTSVVKFDDFLEVTIRMAYSEAYDYDEIWLLSMTEASDGGFIAVGSIMHIVNNHELDLDALVIKFDSKGKIEWVNIISGTSITEFGGLTNTTDGGFVVLGVDFYGTIDPHPIIIKFDSEGNVIWINDLDRISWDSYGSIKETSDGGLIVTGAPNEKSFGRGYLRGLEAKGDRDAILIKLDSTGNIEWVKSFGGKGGDELGQIRETSDGGFIAIGSIDEKSFGTGDLRGLETKGDRNVVVVKFDNKGDVVWVESFGRVDINVFIDIIETSDGGFVSVGGSIVGFFGADYLADPVWVGDDAIIVKFDKRGGIEWKDGQGATGYYDIFVSVMENSKGGYTVVRSDGVIVEYDKTGSVIWESDFKNTGYSFSSGIRASNGGIVIIGCSWGTTYDGLLIIYGGIESDSDGSDGFPLWIVGVAALLIFVVCVAGYVLSRRKKKP